MLLDTSGLYCYLDVADVRHREAVALLDSASRRQTHNYVLAELVALCNARRLDRRLMLDFIGALMNDPAFEVIWVTEQEHQAAMELLRSQPDRDYSLCDAVSFLLMRQRAENQALTTDRHFEQEGFMRLLRG